MFSLLQRLRERKLVQWALAYLAGAFVVVQILDAVAEPLRLSSGIHQAVLAIVVVGFFLALVIAYYHGEKGRQRVSGPELLIIAMLLFLAGGVLSVMRPGGEMPRSPAVTAEDGEKPSLIVLACDNISADSGDAYLADGIHEEILHRLAGISSLTSLGRETARWYRENRKPPSEIAEERGLDFVGECTVRKDPNQEQIRLTFQLLDARGVQVWSEVYDRDLTAENLFDMQSDVAQQVAHAMRAMITPDELAEIDAKPTENLEAYELYLDGRAQWNTRTEDGFWASIDRYRRAISLDSTFAHAYSGLADSYGLLPYYANADGRLTRPLAQLFAQKALSLGPDLVETHTSLAHAQMQNGDFPGAEKQFRNAIAIDPDYSNARMWYSKILSWTGRHDEALEQLRLALESDPLSYIIQSDLAAAYFWARRYEASLREVRKLTEIYPLRPDVWFKIGRVLLQLERFAEAQGAYERWATLTGVSPGPVNRFVSLVWQHRRTRDPIPLPSEFEDPTLLPVDLYEYRYVLLGPVDDALDVLERACDQQGMLPLVIRVQPFYDPLRDHPRFQALLEQYE
jgi:TolB-like protein